MVCSCGNGGGGAISAALFSLFVAARPILLSWQGVVVRKVAVLVLVLVLVLVVAVNATLVSSNNKASHNMVAPKPKRDLMLIVR
jgi:NADH:ubiquinone oxidoreductase subunit K